ncbi:5334_t:CDS:2 [Entrophospora sp. SA101]|nr:5334_t:CDS:2 [Entrophospora sp. SA101]
MQHRINNNQQYLPPPSHSSNIVDDHNHNQRTTSSTQLSPTAISLEDFAKIVGKLQLIFPDCNPNYIRNCLQKEISSNPNKNYNDSSFLQSIVDKLLTVDYPKIGMPESPPTSAPEEDELMMKLIVDLPPSYDEVISTTRNADNEGIRPELPSRHRHQSSPGSETNKSNYYDDFNNISNTINNMILQANLVERLVKKYSKTIKRPINNSTFKYSSLSSSSSHSNIELPILPAKNGKPNRKKCVFSRRSYTPVLFDYDITKKDYKHFIRGMNLIIKLGLKRLTISESICHDLKNSSNNSSAREEHIQKITGYITEYIGVWNKDFFEPRKIKINLHEEKKENSIGILS